MSNTINELLDNVIASKNKKTRRRRLPVTGDVIMSPKFVTCSYENRRKKIIFPDGNLKNKKQSRTGAYDEGRLTAKFVVESAVMQGGSTGHGPHDVYPDGLYISARRLRADGTYDPKGELVRFYMTGAFINIIHRVKFVGKMKQIFA